MKSFHQVPNRYLNAPREKDYYSYFYALLANNGVKRLLDVGTASGDFLYFLPEDISAVGIDSSSDLIKEANQTRKKSNLEYRVSDIENFSSSEYFDAVTILCTLCTIEEWESVLKKCIQLRPRLLLIHDAFNPEPIDIKLGYKDSGSVSASYNFGYNVVSLDSLNRFFSENSASYEISEFQLTTKLSKDLTNPMYNYHANLDGETILTNGSGLVLRMFNVVAKFN
jgi:ubiquinone/menaquinone biosynthesis C-methylase UbiE